MKFHFSDLNKTPLHIAVERNNTEIVQLLLLRPEIDINVKAIYFFHI